MLLDTFASVIALFFEPRYSLGKIITTKACQVTIVMDDACGAYGTFSEIKRFIDSLQSLRIISRSIMETVEDIEREMKPQRISCSVQYLIEEEFLTIKCVSRPVLVRCLNMLRLIKLYYAEGEGFTNPHGKLKNLISSLFFHPLPL
ncbi:hypothetical protein ARALYDRAFT_890955 [Arabidopsis lyrata subsp. lyrata]|uniref:Terpene synthase metal-binding domain-containing protein n=1 Tax=Arabidopsis lyrata subsp. lyrata TaxID=81972 RepID=D7KJ96_ARALL|nr:hypothetical protein ARALYDRAFT_890955 [Arabidopsis lyrata subsp. lyrata]